MHFIEDFFEDEDIAESIMYLWFFREFYAKIIAEILEFVLLNLRKEIARETKRTNRCSNLYSSALQDIDIKSCIMSNEGIDFEE